MEIQQAVEQAQAGNSLLFVTLTNFINSSHQVREPWSVFFRSLMHIRIVVRPYGYLNLCPSFSLPHYGSIK
jgi:hypothetical protein